MIGLPFGLAPDHETVAERSPRTAPTVDGATGPAAGTAGSDGTEAVDVPMAFVDVTVNVYEVPFVRPVTTQVVAGADATQDWPLEAVAV